MPHTYTYTSDSASFAVVAHDLDEAARLVAASEGLAGVADAEDLEAKVEALGGYFELRSSTDARRICVAA